MQQHVGKAYFEQMAATRIPEITMMQILKSCRLTVGVCLRWVVYMLLRVCIVTTHFHLSRSTTAARGFREWDDASHAFAIDAGQSVQLPEPILVQGGPRDFLPGRISKFELSPPSAVSLLRCRSHLLSSPLRGCSSTLARHILSRWQQREFQK